VSLMIASSMGRGGGRPLKAHRAGKL